MIKNITTGKLISNSEIFADSFFKQALGLMFSFRKKNLIMHFKQARKISLHNFFVFHSLQIIVLNENKQVIEIKESFKPFTLYTAKSKGDYCLELALDSSKNLVKIGDFLEITK